MVSSIHSMERVITGWLNWTLMNGKHKHGLAVFRYVLCKDYSIEKYRIVEQGIRKNTFWYKMSENAAFRNELRKN